MWLLIGLVLGTAVLVGPVRLITEGMGRAGWEQSSQDHVLIVVILLYAAPNMFGEVPAVQVSPSRATFTVQSTTTANPLNPTSA